MAAISPHFSIFIFYISLISLSLPPSLSLSSTTIHDLLRSKGLPPGLLPKEVKSYSLSPNGLLQVFLDGPCLTKYENRVIFESVVTANLSYGSLIGVQGLTQEELFLWLPVKDIIVDDPNSGLILFDIGVAHKQLALSLFEDPPSCKSQPKGVLRNHVRKEKGFEGFR
ncbi:hypothetical protein IC582_014465 [Cucumis melo]|uniref:Uncharacterized protein LOC103493397 n=2 Tax=Cucumis melo TaxID=3656 RepID=A0A1S3BUE7_CUCME|nr:uncharacterized protein LOC103493397 [Cucumis melo]KAA0065854.1 uncharacterized protein E6C27_scaffold17893G00010 [Cucumis melo var. makuwa]TYK04789.1 uncharacterized protein E5676_scaffold68G001090 [Cucumis melo var. makuwa]